MYGDIICPECNEEFDPKIDGMIDGNRVICRDCYFTIDLSDDDESEVGID